MASHGEQHNDIAGREFRSGFRGYDPDEVRVFLRTVAGRVADLEERIESLRGEVADLEAREPELGDLDSSQLAAAIGQETTRVLEAAREAAAGIRQNGEENVGRLLREARDEATTIRDEADRVRREAQEHAASVTARAEAEAEAIRTEGQAEADRMRAEASEVLGVRTAEAEAVANELTSEATDLRDQAQRLEAVTREQTDRELAEAHQAAERVRADAEATAELARTEATTDAEATRSQADHDAAATREHADIAATELRTTAETEVADLRAQARAEAEAIVDEARQTGRDMVQEAQLVRERMLRDLARRRKQARNQLDQLRAGRDRLLEAYARVRVDLDDVTQELGVAVAEARVAADAASVPDEEATDDEVRELEVDIEAARLIGHPLLDPAEDRGESDDHDAEVIDEEDEEVAAPIADDEAESAVGEIFDIEEGAGQLESEVLEVPAPEDDEPEGDDAGAMIEPDEPDEPDEDLADDGDIDALFARIRASRTEAVEDAHGVLAGSESDESVDIADGDTEPEPEGPAVEAHDDDSEGPATDGKDSVDEATVVDAVVAARDALLAEVGPGLGRRLKRTLADDQNEILDTLRRHTRGALRIEAVLPDETAQKQAYAETASEVIVQVAEAGAAQVGGAAGPVGDVLDQLAAQIAEPLRARITDIVGENPDDAEEASSRVRSLFREWRSQVIDTATTDALLGAFSLGAYDATPDGSSLRWVIVDEACPDAHDNVLAGDLTKGQLFPTGQCRGPAHPGCWCLSWPVEQLDEAPTN